MQKRMGSAIRGEASGRPAAGLIFAMAVFFVSPPEVSFSACNTQPKSYADLAACPGSGISYSGLGEGRHTFQVRAIDSSENVDPSPAGYTFNVVLSSPAGSVEAGASPPVSVAAAPAATVAASVAVKRHRHRRHRRRRHHHRQRGSRR